MMIPIRFKCKGDYITKEYPVGTRLQEIIDKEKICNGHPILGAIINNSYKDLSYQIYKPKNVQFITMEHSEGIRSYVRTLIFVLYKVVKEFYPKTEFTVVNPISKGIYCTVTGDNVFLEENDVIRIRKRMEEIINNDLPIKRKEMLTEEAIKLFEGQGLHAKTALLKSRGYVYTSVYKLGEHVDYFYGNLAPSTGKIETFGLEKYYNGILLRIPDPTNPSELNPLIDQTKLMQIFSEFKRWGKILDIKNVGDLNRWHAENKTEELIQISEALHEKKVAMIADKIRKLKKKVKVILISGPSASGKTTFSKRLAIQLRVNGLSPVKMSLDNYFVDREKTPLDENGEYDFEAVEALDLQKLNQDLNALLDGKEIELPKFSFENGSRYYDGEKLKISKKEVLIIEGIHALNPLLTANIDNEHKFKIYLAALTSISIDGHNRIPTSDNRLIRRIVRDHNYRSYSAADTIKRWPSVKRGEDKNIFPYQEEADIMFNSALLYELAVLKKHIEPILQQVQRNEEEYAEAERLLKFFSFFKAIDDKYIPPTSILREFLGGSSFRYD